MGRVGNTSKTYESKYALQSVTNSHATENFTTLTKPTFGNILQ
jgi:hypothetical protein